MPETIDQPKIGRIHTSCKNCFFSVWKDKTQTHCSLGLIEKFKTDDKVIEVFDEVGDEFFIINDRHCQFKRSIVWGHRFGNNHDNAYQLARSEVYPKPEFIIYIDALDKETFKKIEQSLKSINPKKISSVTLVNNSLQDPEPLSQFLQPLLLDLQLGNIKRKHIIEDATYQRCCDLAIKESKNIYFLVCRAGFKFPEKQIDELDIQLNDKFQPFSLLEFDSDTYFGNVILYKMVGGNKERPFIDKIKDAAKREEKETLIIHA